MRRMVLASIGAMLAVTASGIMASTSIGVSTAGAAELASKTAFCGANIAIDKASTKVDSNAGFLNVLKQHTSALSTMDKNLPSGKIGSEARDEVVAARAAIASGSVNDLNTVPSSAGGDIDTYCGVATTGRRCRRTSAKVRRLPSARPSFRSSEAVGNASTGRSNDRLNA